MEEVSLDESGSMPLKGRIKGRASRYHMAYQDFLDNIHHIPSGLSGFMLAQSTYKPSFIIMEFVYICIESC